jgi:hypothetical protein
MRQSDGALPAAHFLLAIASQKPYLGSAVDNHSQQN